MQMYSDQIMQGETAASTTNRDYAPATANRRSISQNEREQMQQNYFYAQKQDPF
jgi:hypothetical protein